MKLGLIIGLRDEIEDSLGKVRAFGLSTCQVSCGDPTRYTPEMSRRLSTVSRVLGVEVTSLWAGCPGRHVWDFIEGPTTIGLVPLETREMRVAALKAGADFAALTGLPSITTHVGFLPENPSDPVYPGVIEALRDVATHCKQRGLLFQFETGQETPTALLRAMRDIGTDNLGINLDPANLLMYGKANPVDALDLLGPYVKGVHAKDGEYPTDPSRLGVEKRLGDGRVNFPAFVAKLKTFDYNGALTIEREISGEQQQIDIRRAIDFLMPLLQGDRS